MTHINKKYLSIFLITVILFGTYLIFSSLGVNNQKASVFDVDLKPNEIPEVNPGVIALRKIEERNIVSNSVNFRDIYSKFLASKEILSSITSAKAVIVPETLYVTSGSTLPGYGPVPFPAGADDDSWKTNDGITYTNITQSSAYGQPIGIGPENNGRLDGAMVYFKDRVWLIGGYGYGTPPCMNDVWSSPDGINNWRRELKNAPWSPRADHTVTVFNGNLYLIGGMSCGTSNLTLNGAEEVWTSPDGIAWKKVTPGTLTFHGRAGHTTVVFNNKMYVMGGYGNIGGSNNYSSDVFSSSDGKNWVKTTAPWPIRANHTSVVYGGGMWVIGGASQSPAGYQLPYFGMLPVSGTIYSDVWYSPDGINWSLVTNTPAFGMRAGHSSVVLNGKMHVIGGSANFTGNYIYKNSYYSTDGINWTLGNVDFPVSRTEAHAVVTPITYGNGIYPLPVVTTVQATSTNTTIDLKGNLNPANTPTTSWFEYMYYIGSTATNSLETPEVSTGSVPIPVNVTLSNQIPGSNYYYRLVSQNKNGLVRGSVLSQFTSGCNPVVTWPTINMLHPNGGEVFTAGQSITVNWSSCNFPSSNLVNIAIVGGWGTLISATANDGNETVTFPATLPPGSYNLLIKNSIPGVPPIDFTNSPFVIQ